MSKTQFNIYIGQKKKKCRQPKLFYDIRIYAIETHT